MSNEEAVIARVLGGDVQAFRWIVERYQGPVFRVAQGLLSDAAEAEDVAQDVLLTAFNRLAEYDANRAALASWLFVIARHKCLNVLKRRRPGVITAAAEPIDRRTPDENLIRVEWLGHLDAALSELPCEQRIAFVLAEIEETPYEEIATIEGVPLGTVKSRVARAKEKLRRLLAPMESER